MINIKNFIDISWPISEKTTRYKDNKTLVFKSVKDFKSDGVCDSEIHLSSHTGTHIDAPKHFVENGVSIDKIPLTSFVGQCTVLDMTHIEEKITAGDIPIINESIVLFKTKNSFYPTTGLFKKDFIYIDKLAAEKLVDNNIKTVGIDYLGIERNQPGHETHRAFLSRNIPIIEGLFLKNVEPGDYFLICLPLAVQGLDAAPARAILI